MGKSAKTEALKQMLTLPATLRISQSDMLSRCCCSCEVPGHKSLYINCDLVVAAVSSSSLSAHLDLPSKPRWQVDIPTALPYFRTKLPRQEYVSTCSGVLQLPKSSGLTAHALEKYTGFSRKSNCKVQATGHDVKSR